MLTWFNDISPHGTENTQNHFVVRTGSASLAIAKFLVSVYSV